MAFRTLAQMMGLTTPVPASTTKPAGHPDAECRFSPFGESATAENVNRPHYALGENTDDLNTRMTREIASPEIGVLTAFSGSSIIIDPSGGAAGDINYTGTLYCGESGWTGQERHDQIFQLLDENYNEVIVSGSEVKITSLSGNTIGDGFVATATTLNLSASVPSANYRIGYYVGTNVGELPPYALTLAGIRGLEEVSGEYRPAAQVSYDGGPAWHDGTTNPATDVEAQLDKIVTDLVSNDGSDRIGATAKTSDFEPMVAGSIEDQVVTLTARLDAMETRDTVTRAINWTPRALSLSGQYIGVIDGGTLLGSGQRRHQFAFFTQAGAGPEVIDGGFFGVTSTPSWSTPAPTQINGMAWGLAGLSTGIWVAVGQRGPTPGSNGAAIETEITATTSPWSAATVPAPYNTGAANLFDVIYDPSTDYFVALGNDGSSPGVLRSSNGTTWTAATTPPSTGYTKLVHDGAGNILAYGAAAGIYKSTDGGDTWSQVTASNIFTQINHEARSGRWVAFILNSGLNDFYVSNDATAATWTIKLAAATTVREPISMACDGRGLVVLGAAGGDVRWSTNLGTTWSFDQVYDANVMTTNKGLIFVAQGMKFVSGRFIQLCDDTPEGYWYSLAQESSITGAVV